MHGQKWMWSIQSLRLKGKLETMETLKADQIVEAALDAANESLGKLLNAEVLALKGPMRQPIDESVRLEIENLKKNPKRNGKNYDKIVIMLETSGGFIEAVERIAIVLRRNYKFVEFIVPNYAYSAGTVLVMSGDEIYMDYFSVLGPIDPQYPGEDGNYVPGMGYLAKFNELAEAVNKDPTGSATRAELAILLKKFDPAKLFDIEQAIEHSKSLLEDWLPQYKFKDWTKRESSQKKVTAADRKARAVEVAEALGDAKHWHSHGRGITIRELQSDKIKLKVKDFGEDQELNAAIRHYHGLFVDYMQKRAMKGSIHCRRGIRRIA